MQVRNLLFFAAALLFINETISSYILVRLQDEAHGSGIGYRQLSVSAPGNGSAIGYRQLSVSAPGLARTAPLPPPKG